MTLLLAIAPGGGNWSADAWERRFSANGCHDVVRADRAFDPAEVTYAACWKPNPGLLATLPNLRVIFNLGAGVDALLADPTLPDLPIVRVVDADLTKRMTEYVVWQVLDHHRQGGLLRAAQARGDWIGPDQAAAKSLRVGVMGLGEIAQDAIEVLVRLGFRVAGWSRRGRALPGIDVFEGASGLPSFLARTDVLVCLLPLTRETRGMINRGVLQGLARDGVLGAPVLINAGRGGLQVEADILAALDDGTLGAATLDVFETEPLPAASALWRHPRATLTPHNAADSDPDEIARYVAGQIATFEAGGGLRHVIDRTRGY